MKIRKAVITAAGRAQRALPLQALVDRDGQQKSALKIIIDEALSTGVEEICLVISPGDQRSYQEAAGEAAGRLHFAQQLVRIAETQQCAVSGVQPTRENVLPFYGTVGGRRVAGQSDLYEVEHV